MQLILDSRVVSSVGMRGEEDSIAESSAVMNMGCGP
jgi:hypothetical protein